MTAAHTARIVTRVRPRGIMRRMDDAPRLLLAAALLLGCPRLPPVSGCEPLAQRCEGDRPQVCSPSRRWHYVGDEPCGATPGQSCQVRAGVAGCAR